MALVEQSCAWKLHVQLGIHCTVGMWERVIHCTVRMWELGIHCTVEMWELGIHCTAGTWEPASTVQWMPNFHVSPLCLQSHSKESVSVAFR